MKWRECEDVKEVKTNWWNKKKEREKKCAKKNMYTQTDWFKKKVQQLNAFSKIKLYFFEWENLYKLLILINKSMRIIITVKLF